MFWDFWGFRKRAKIGTEQKLVTWKPKTGNWWFISARRENRGRDTSTTAAVFLLAIVYKQISIHKKYYDLQ